jgi:methyltransferase (TIGR00027 family)
MPETGIPRGVDRTAIFVSRTRMQEGRRPDALFRDPFAEVVMSELADSPEMSQLAGIVDAASSKVQAGQHDGDKFAYFAVRTRYFDDRLLAATRRGISQVAVLAAGLDGRPVRLDWPTGTRLYELDLPDMIAFKDKVLAKSGLAPRCDRRGVAADLSADWSAKLLEAGFDPGATTIWLLEGLLQYLTPESGDALLAKLTELSAPGSELLLEHNNSEVMDGEAARPVREAVEAIGAVWLSARDDLQPWLAGYGWHAEVHAGSDPAIGHGREVPEIPATWLAHAVLGCFVGTG